MKKNKSKGEQFYFKRNPQGHKKNANEVMYNKVIVFFFLYVASGYIVKYKTYKCYNEGEKYNAFIMVIKGVMYHESAGYAYSTDKPPIEFIFS